MWDPSFVSQQQCVGRACGNYLDRPTAIAGRDSCFRSLSVVDAVHFKRDRCYACEDLGPLKQRRGVRAAPFIAEKVGRCVRIQR